MHKQNELRDYGCPEPGEVKEMTCDICGTVMDVTRNAEGPTSSVMAMAKLTRVHDFFRCHHREKDWHRQAKALLKLANDTPSLELAKMFEKEAKRDVLHNRKATKTFRE
jgi:hypothetical protein